MSIVDISGIKISLVTGVNTNDNFKALKIQVNPSHDKVKIITYIFLIFIPPPSVVDCSSLIRARQREAAKRLQHARGLVSHSAGGTRELHLRHQHCGCKQSNHGQGWRRGWNSRTLRWSEKWRIDSTSGTQSKDNTTAEAGSTGWKRSNRCQSDISTWGMMHSVMTYFVMLSVKKKALSSNIILIENNSQQQKSHHLLCQSVNHSHLFELS